MKSLILVLIGMPIMVSCQIIQTKSFDVNDSAFHVKGNFIKGLNWTDKLGDNYLILSSTGPTESVKGSREIEVELHGYNFLKKENKKQLLWEIMDSERKCFEEMDLQVKFILEGVSITDLNKNGICEAWLIYKMSCRSDVRPAKMKIIMHEGDKQYVILGENRVPYVGNEYIGGQKEMDANFENGQKEFKEYGLNLWQRFINEDFK